jgi:hypothetical protein
MVVNAYLLPEEFDNQPTTNKAFTVKKVIWNTGVSDSAISLKQLPQTPTQTPKYYQIDGGGTRTSSGADWLTNLSNIPAGLVSGSSQIDLYLTQNFTEFSVELFYLFNV